MALDPQVVQWFGSVDVDRSGRITAPELQSALMSSNGRKFNETATRLMIVRLGVRVNSALTSLELGWVLDLGGLKIFKVDGLFDGGQGSIDVSGFAQLYTYVNQWLAAFRSYDKNGSGYIDTNEFTQALQTMGYRFTPQFVQLLANKFGEKSGGGLAVDGFITACILIQKFTDGFRAKDTQQQGIITIAYEDFLSIVLNSWI